MENILVCDDDKEIVDAIEIYLEQEGFRVYKAYDGIEAIEVMQDGGRDGRGCRCGLLPERAVV